MGGNELIKYTRSFDKHESNKSLNKSQLAAIHTVRLLAIAVLQHTDSVALLAEGCASLHSDAVTILGSPTHRETIAGQRGAIFPASTGALAEISLLVVFMSAAHAHKLLSVSDDAHFFAGAIFGVTNSVAQVCLQSLAVFLDDSRTVFAASDAMSLVAFASLPNSETTALETMNTREQQHAFHAFIRTVCNSTIEASQSGFAVHAIALALVPVAVKGLRVHDTHPTPVD